MMSFFLQDTDDIFYSDDDDGGDENIVPKRLPLFSRCPQTNTAIFQVLTTFLILIF